MQSNPVNKGTEGAIESVRIKRVEFTENVRVSLPRDKAKQTVRGVRIKRVEFRENVRVFSP